MDGSFSFPSKASAQPDLVSASLLYGVLLAGQKSDVPDNVSAQVVDSIYSQALRAVALPVQIIGAQGVAPEVRKRQFEINAASRCVIF